MSKHVLRKRRGVGGGVIEKMSKPLKALFFEVPSEELAFVLLQTRFLLLNNHRLQTWAAWAHGQK